jgi:hypothetical protein
MEFDKHLKTEDIEDEDDYQISHPLSQEQLEERMLEDHSYPLPSQKNFQEAIYVKREFILNVVPERGLITSDDERREYRENKCGPNFRLTETQTLVSNFINPETPYKGLLLYYGTGVGKTCAAVAIAEKFKPLVEKYGTRIYVLVPGPLNKQNFLTEIRKCTGETYLNAFQDKTTILDAAKQSKIEKHATDLIQQYYRIITYKSFYRRVLGEKIKDKVIKDGKMKSVNRKLTTGEVERDRSVEHIDSLNNTLLIVDEAHNVTKNQYGDALKAIVANSKNLKIVLLSATPAKNYADDMIELINLMRPQDDPIIRDKVFQGPSSPEMTFKPGGREYFRDMVRGYVSYLRGSDPLTFAERIDMGEIPPGLDFTKVIRCFMSGFQLETYLKADTMEDRLNHFSAAVANFVFPGFSKSKTSKGELEGYFGISGMVDIKAQLENNQEALCKKIATTILSKFDIKHPSNLMQISKSTGNITGDIFQEKYLPYFSVKFATALKNVNETVYGARGSGLVFVHSNFVQNGTNVFKEVLLRNGYVEYQIQPGSYTVAEDTRCYFCGHQFSKHSQLPPNIPKHQFGPATFLTVTGKTDDAAADIPEEKHIVMRNIFNNTNNKDGKFIKIVLGSKVMSESMTLKNIKEIHILDVHFTLGRVDQVIGRGIRFCTHFNIYDEVMFPKVDIFKYTVSLPKGTRIPSKDLKDASSSAISEGIKSLPLLSSEEELYKRAEAKYRLIKETERIMQEEAIDCPLNINANIFPEEIKRYGDCGTPDKPCPAICGYMPCQFKCGDKLLNAKFYDKNRGIYRKLQKSEIDYSTYNKSLAKEEINFAKDRIKEMFKLEHVYTAAEILDYVKQAYTDDKKDLFDDFYVYQALDDLLPETNNDFNNFKDTLTDNLNRPGYLIYRYKFYIFQMYDLNEDAPMYYRTHPESDLINKVSLRDHIHGTQAYKSYRSKGSTGATDEENADIEFSVEPYDFDSVQDYYNARPEFEYVGIVDKESTRKKTRTSEIEDVFKIREARPTNNSKKRETGIPSLNGAVCATSKNKKYILTIADLLGLDLDTTSREPMCDAIRDKLYALEKYSTDAQGNKMTYLRIPANHPIIPFPLNLEDRVQSIINSIQKETRVNLKPSISIKKLSQKELEVLIPPVPEDEIPPIGSGIYPDILYVKYVVDFNKSMDKFADIMERHGAKKEGNKWVLVVE